MNKVVANADEAIRDMQDGAVIMSGGFGLCGNPENLIEAIHRKGVKNLTVISNNCGTTDKGLGVLLQSRQVRKMILASGLWQSAAWGLPVNQHDLAGTTLLFSQVIIDGLRKLGMNVTAANAFLRAAVNDADALRTTGGAYGETSARLMRQLASHLGDEEELVVPLILDRGELQAVSALNLAFSNNQSSTPTASSPPYVVEDPQGVDATQINGSPPPGVPTASTWPTAASTRPTTRRRRCWATARPSSSRAPFSSCTPRSSSKRAPSAQIPYRRTPARAR